MPTAEQRRALRRILQVEAELEPIVLRALRRSVRRTLRPLGLTASAQRPTPEDMRALVGFWHQEIDKLISPAMLKLFQKAAEDTMGLLPGALDLGNIGKNIRDVRAAAWFGTVKNRLVGVGENMYQDVASSLRDSYAAGEGVDKQAARIRNVMGNEATANRAARIARTEGAAIVNGADHSVALELEQAGIVNKRKWLATEDARTRPTHAAADGQLVGINEPFLVGGSRLLYPSDPAGPPEEVIQCRCTTLLEVTEQPVLPENVDLSNTEQVTQKVGEIVQGVLDKHGLNSEWNVQEGGYVNGWILHENGQRVGRIVRKFEGTSVEHSGFKLDKEYQGQGIASEINHAMEDWYRANGVKTITLYANIDVGGYAWARAGYDWDAVTSSGDAARVARRVAEAMFKAGDDEADVWLRDILDQLDGPREDWPTPYDLAMTGYTEGAKTWPGREGTLGSRWRGIKHLE